MRGCRLSFRTRVITAIVCCCVTVPVTAAAQADLTPPLPPAPAPAPESASEFAPQFTRESTDSAPRMQPAPQAQCDGRAPALSASPVLGYSHAVGHGPVAAPCCPAPQRGYTHGRRDTRRRCQICDPNAPLNAMSRVTPAGTALHAIMGTQIANGVAAQLVLYEYDFHPNEPRLNCHGMMRLLDAARQLSRTPFPLLIQPTLIDPTLDNARREFVVGHLLSLEPALSAERVVIGFPPSRGLDGVDAVLTHDRVLRLSAGGVPGAGSTAGTLPPGALPLAR